jgi:hypothetical protein
MDKLLLRLAIAITYTVTSTGSDGVSDGEESPGKQFTTPGPGERTQLSEGPDKQGL